MNAPKYFVIRCTVTDEGESGIILSLHNKLADARAHAERCAVAYPDQRYLVATEMQSVVGKVQVTWSDK